MVWASLVSRRPEPTVDNLRILIADDHEIVRWGLKALLSSQPGWFVCAEASSGREAVVLATQHRPDIVVMDISMPGLNGLEATRKIRKMLPKTQVLVLSSQYSDQVVQEVVNAGARAYLLKSDPCRDFLRAVEALIDNRSFFTAGAAQVVIDEVWNRRSGTELSETQASLKRRSLSGREREIVQLLAEGRTSKEVAAILGISVKTVGTHRANIMRKLEIHSVSDLVLYAVKNNMIEP